MPSLSRFAPIRLGEKVDAGRESGVRVSVISGQMKGEREIISERAMRRRGSMERVRIREVWCTVPVSLGWLVFLAHTLLYISTSRAEVKFYTRCREQVPSIMRFNYNSNEVRNGVILVPQHSGTC